MAGQFPAGMHGLAGSDDAMSILLIFPTEDPLCRRFVKAADRLGLACEVATIDGSGSGNGSGVGGEAAASALAAAAEKYGQVRHHLVLLDRREASTAAAVDALLRTLKASAATHPLALQSASTFAAVSKAGPNRSAHLSDLLLRGYDMKIKEDLCACVEGCAEELLSVQRNTFRYQQRLGSLEPVLTALGNCTDAVEITDDKLVTQYVNPAHERMFGFSLGDLAGRSSLDAIRRPVGADRSDEDSRSLAFCLKRGRAWDGLLTGRRKSGASFDYYGAVYPVRDAGGSIRHFVWLRRSLNGQGSGAGGCGEQTQQSQQKQHHQQLVSHHASIGRHSSSALTTPNRQAASRRSSAAARLNSTAAIDAPINKVINLISMVQEGSTPAVAAALDKVVEILHQSGNLYTGDVASSQEDKMMSDYVGGLMASGARLLDKKRNSVGNQRRQRPSEIMREHIDQLLESSANTMQLLKETPDHLLPYLEADTEWSFDILELERVTDKKPMVHLAMRTLRRFGVCQYLQCSEDTMLRWLHVIQDHYRPSNCYHNATHGTDVMQCSAYFLARDRVKAAFDETDEAASLLGALVHDLDHPGRTNPFLVNSQHRLALLYNDISVLESHHVSLAFQLTANDDRINIFKGMGREDYISLRQSIIDVVLATEMARHFEHVGKFANQILTPLLVMEEELEEEDGVVVQPISEEEAQELLTRPENRALIRRVLIKCADVSNPCRPLKLCKEWARRISEEYFQQTDEEKSKGLPIVMPVFDRATCNMPRSQVSFIDFFLKEMFTVWHKFCDVPVLMDNLSTNYAYWKKLIDEEAAAEKDEAAEAAE